MKMGSRHMHDSFAHRQFSHSVRVPFDRSVAETLTASLNIF